jgi:GTP cyclohydrolase II
MPQASRREEWGASEEAGVGSWSDVEDIGQVAVERAISEIRAGRPVVVRRGEQAILAFPVEALEQEQAEWIAERAAGRARLVLSWPRLHYLGVQFSEAGAFVLPEIDLARIERLAIAVGARADAEVLSIDPLEFAALDLCRLALVLPAIVVLAAEPKDAGGFLEASAAQVRSFRAGRRRLLRIVGRAPVPLERAVDSEFVVFRGGEGLRDQVAVIVGKPDFAEPVTVRLHSACLTGDLFGSLKCDCGDQLRATARYLAENGGGVLLYLDQEGRGNGIGNKIRAYRLQAQGFDTYDADEVLGFDHDQRGFAFAAEMLRQLGVSRVRIMTNNPIKIAALEDAGLDVVSDHRILGRKTAQNRAYLEAKRDRAGHLIDMDAAPSGGKSEG